MNLQKYISIFTVTAAIAGLGSTASALVCNRSIPTGPFFCGSSRAQAATIDDGIRVKYHVASNGRPVTGVPVRADGSTRVPEHPETGGGTCDVVSASRAGQISERTCRMVNRNEAKRYLVQQL